MRSSSSAKEDVDQQWTRLINISHKILTRWLAKTNLVPKLAAMTLGAIHVVLTSGWWFISFDYFSRNIEACNLVRANAKRLRHSTWILHRDKYWVVSDLWWSNYWNVAHIRTTCKLNIECKSHFCIIKTHFCIIVFISMEECTTLYLNSYCLYHIILCCVDLS